MTLGSLTQLWAVGALISAILGIFLSLIIIKEDNKKVSKSQLSASQPSTTSSGSSPTFSPGERSNSSQMTGGTND